MTKDRVTPVTMHSETGLSLISLMIGIALSTITILTATHMHTTHQIAVNELNDSIRHNRLVLTSLKVIEKEIQSAGFGIADADQSHVVTQFDPGDSTTPATRSILWRYVAEDNDGNTQNYCRGLRESGVHIKGIEHRVLSLIGSSSCLLTNPLETTNWNQTIGRLGLWKVRGELTSHINQFGTLFSFQLATTDCSFPGLNIPDTHLSATITAPNNAQLNGHALPPNGTTVCLTNINPS